MASNRTTQNGREHDDTEAVNAYMGALEHPLKSVVAAIRRTILGADQTITEGIKWNSPSFYCHGWFATVNLRARDSVQVVLHHGAKVRDDTTLSASIVDTIKLLTWLSKDRAIVLFTNDEDLHSKQAAFESIIRQWATYQATVVTL